ncbi:unnamed protein product [Effrenium voratum]|nr:unnamed protein product [Effrenium voratum]
MADPAKEPSNWTEHTQSDGRRYYYNKVNKLSSWEKPECLKNPDEKLNTTVWKEPPRWQVMLLGRRSKVKLARAGHAATPRQTCLCFVCGGGAGSFGFPSMHQQRTATAASRTGNVLMGGP